MKQEDFHQHNRELIDTVQSTLEHDNKDGHLFLVLDEIRNVQNFFEQGVLSKDFSENLDRAEELSKDLLQQVQKLRQEKRWGEQYNDFFVALVTLCLRLRDNIQGWNQFQKEAQTQKEAGFYLLAVEEYKKNVEVILELFHKLPPKKYFLGQRMKQFLKPKFIAPLTGFVTAVGLVFALKTESPDNSTSEKNIPSESTKKEQKLPQAVENGTDQGEGDIDSEGDPGEFKKGEYIAKVEMKSSFRKPSLWVNSVSTRFPDGKFRTIERGEQEGSKSDRVSKKESVAKVHFYKKKVNAGDRVSLLVPVGYKARVLSVEPFPQEYRQERNILTFSRGGEVEIHYEIVSAKEDFTHEVQAITGNYSGEYMRAVEALKSGEDGEEVLEKYFEDFTYIVSGELNSMLRQMPGTFSEKVGGIKIGDCDTLSNHANGMFTDAGKNSVVARGILRDKDQLDAARKHARFVYADSDQQWQEYELTSIPQKSYVNVRFERKDKKVLDAKIEEMKSETDPQVLQQKYHEFGQELRQILAQDSYKKYEPKPEVTDSQGEATPGEKKFIFTLENVLKDLLNLADSEPMLIGAILALVVSLFGGMLKIDKAARKRSGRIRKEQVEDILKLLSNWDSHSHSAISNKLSTQVHESLKKYTYLSTSKEQSHELRSLEDDISKETIEKLDPEQQKVFLLLSEAATKIIVEPYRVYRVLSLASQVSEWKSFCTLLEKNGVNIDVILEKIRQKLRDPKTEKALLKHAPEVVQNIMQEGAKRVPSLSRPLDAPVPTLEQFLTELGVDRPDDLKVQNRPGTGHELYQLERYRPGDDPKRINWKATARTGKVISSIMAQEQEVGKVTASRLNLVVDVASVEKSELEKLVGLLHVVQRHPQKLQIESLYFVAHGRAVDRWDTKMLQQLTQKGKPQNIEILIQRIIEMQLKESLKGSVALTEREGEYSHIKEINSLTSFVPVSLPIKGEALVLGRARLVEGTPYQSMRFVEDENSKKIRVTFTDIDQKK